MPPFMRWAQTPAFNPLGLPYFGGTERKCSKSVCPGFRILAEPNEKMRCRFTLCLVFDFVHGCFIKVEILQISPFYLDFRSIADSSLTVRLYGSRSSYGDFCSKSVCPGFRILAQPNEKMRRRFTLCLVFDFVHGCFIKVEILQISPFYLDFRSIADSSLTVRLYGSRSSYGNFCSKSVCPNFRILAEPNEKIMRYRFTLCLILIL